MKTPRRIALKRMFASLLGVTGVAIAANAKTEFSVDFNHSI